MFQYLRHAKIDTVWTAHGFDIKRVSDLASLSPNIVNGVYHYNNGNGIVRSRSKEAWLADRYLQDFEVQRTPAERFRWAPQQIRWVSGKGGCLGSTQSWGWFMLGPNKDQVRYLLQEITEEHMYGLSCINNRNWDIEDHDIKYKESVRLLLELFLGVAEPGAKFLYATDILDSDGADENDDNGGVEDDERQQEREEERVEASDAEVPLPDFSRQQFHRRSRGLHGYAGTDTDAMVVAVGNTYVLSFYCYMSRFWG